MHSAVIDHNKDYYNFLNLDKFKKKVINYLNNRS